MSFWGRMVMERSIGVTLVRVAATARILHRLRVPISVIGLAAAGWFVWVLIDTTVTSARALVPLAIFLWAALALAVGFTLTQPPQPIEPGDRFFLRLKKRLIRVGYFLSLAAMLALVVMTLFLSYRAWQLS